VIIILTYFKGLDRLPSEVIRRSGDANGDYASMSFQASNFDFIYIKYLKQFGAQA
jgi:hypothetical protein